MKDAIIDKITASLIFLIRKLNRYKSRCPSMTLYRLVDQYNMNPKGDWG